MASNIRKKKSAFQQRLVLDALRALEKWLDSNFTLICSWHAGNCQHAAPPSKRYARRGIYYRRRIPYSFPLEGSSEDELSCPGSASIQTLRQAAYLLPTQNTLHISVGRLSGGRTILSTQRIRSNATPAGHLPSTQNILLISVGR